MQGLADVVVVEVVGSLAGAQAAKLLGGLGATVVSMDPVGRHAPLRAQPAQWAAFGTGRRHVEGDEAGHWLERADVVIESSASGVPSWTWPLPDDVVNVRISPFGEQRGPYVGWRGADIVDQAIGGHLYLSGMPDREPLIGPVNQAALASGVFGAIGALAALRARRAGAGGQTVEVSHHETLAALHQFTDVRYTHNGNVLKRLGNRYAGPGSPIGMYRAKDGWIALTVATAAHGEMLLLVTDLNHLMDEPGVTTIMDVMLNGPLLDPALNGWLAQHTVAEAVDILQSVRLASGPVLSMRQLLDDPHLAERDWWRATTVDGREVKIPGPPFHITGVEWRTESTLEPTAPPAVPTVDAEAAERPLAGIRVLDLTRVWAGPLAARILADLGAEVVMVEAPWARTPRVMPQSYVDASHFFPDDRAGEHPWNRNGFINKFAVSKRSIGLD